MTAPLLGRTTSGEPLAVDVDRLISTRMLLTANSGAGKSWALRRLLEQTHGRIQQLVIDPEGEFFTLRPLLESYPEPLSYEDLAAAAGYTAGAGAFNNPRGRLRSLGLIEYDPPGHARARSILFLDGGR